MDVSCSIIPRITKLGDIYDCDDEDEYNNYRPNIIVRPLISIIHIVVVNDDDDADDDAADDDDPR